MLPGFLERCSFHYVRPSHEPQEGLLQLAASPQHVMQTHGVLCWMQTPGLHPFPDLTQPEVAFPLFHQADIDPTMVTHMEDIYLRNLDMPELIEKARLAVVGHASKLLQADPDREISYIVLDLPCTFFMLRSLRWATLPAHWLCCFFTLHPLGGNPSQGLLACCHDLLLPFML